MKLSTLTDEEIRQLALNKKLKFIFSSVGDDGENYDVAIVLGGPINRMEERAAACARLYKTGRVKKVITSGGVKREVSCGTLITEAQHLKNLLTAYGVNEEDIILENEARTTNENMICSVIHLSRLVKNAKKVVIVTSHTHLFRSLLYAKNFLPRFYKIHGYANFNVIKNYNDESETTNLPSEEIERITKEIIYVKQGITAGFFEDLDI